MEVLNITAMIILFGTKFMVDFINKLNKHTPRALRNGICLRKYDNDFPKGIRVPELSNY